jgi:hypothetical protein
MSEEKLVSPNEASGQPGEPGAYTTPKLRRLGSVRDLTLGGGLSRADGSGFGKGTKRGR